MSASTHTYTPTIPFLAVTSAIDQEPELPGEMPEELWNAVKAAVTTNNKVFAAELFRITVRKTKAGIRERVIAEFVKPDPTTRE